MTEYDESQHGLGAEQQELGRQLAERRPVPAPLFRGALARRLAERDPGFGHRPEWLRLTVVAYMAAGGTLIAFGALVATGIA